MHGLMGGSWKRSAAPATDAEKNNPAGKPRGTHGSTTYRRSTPPRQLPTLHQESVPVEGCDRRRWPGLQRVIRDFQRGPSQQAPAKRHSALGRLTALACRDTSLARPWTANPGEKTSL